MNSRPSAPRRLFQRLTSDDARVLPDYFRSETTGGLIMLAATILALLWANLHQASYASVRAVELGPLTVQHWAADGLLTIFFFVAGLELKRELTSGSLSKPSEALVPIVAAIGGMIVPALIYLAVNTIGHGNPGGWAIPMATDIAFALAVLAAVGSGLPASLRAFLLTLAIVDDLGAIIVIATVFTSDLRPLWLVGAIACAATWWLLQRKRIDHWALYVPLFVGAWWCTHESGVHATIAGVLLGLLTRSEDADHNDPVDRWNHFWHPISAGFVVPFFALMSAGVLLTPEAIQKVVVDPVSLGIIAGLLLGKPIGVFGGAFLTAHLSHAELASDLSWRDIFAVSLLAGVGFTVALFVSELAFLPLGEELVDGAKAAILVASIIAALVGALMLRRRGKAHAEAAEQPL